jgi:hypothetical protein
MVASQEPMPGKMPPMGFGPPGPVGMHGSMGNPSPMMMNISDLKALMADISIDKAVSTHIVAIARSFLTLLDERVLKIEREEIAIKEELLKEKPDLAAIQATIAKKSQILSDIEFAQIRRDLDIKALLTQDEYDRWKSAMMQKMKQMMPRPQDIKPQGPRQPGKD